MMLISEKLPNMIKPQNLGNRVILSVHIWMRWLIELQSDRVICGDYDYDHWRLTYNEVQSQQSPSSSNNPKILDFTDYDCDN